MKVGLFILVSVSVVSSTAAAATITVNSTSDDVANTTSCTLRDAVAAANTDGAVDGCAAGTGADVIVVPAGTYVLTEPLSLTTEMTIRGSGSTQTILDGNNATRIATIGATGAVTLQRVAVKRGSVLGSSSGGGLSIAGTLHATDCAFDSNFAGYMGGAAHVTGVASFTRCVFQNGRTDQNGVAGIAIDCIATITACSFGNNTSTLYGGAVLVRAAANATIRGSLFTGNTARHGGALLALGAGTTLVISNSTFVANTALQLAGAMYRDNTGSARLDHVSFIDNHAGTAGGGLFWSGDTRAIHNSLFAGNTAGADADCSGSTTGSNNIQETGGCTFVGTGNLVGVAPLVGSLSSTGGPTSTVPVLTGSPAIGASDCSDGSGGAVSTDQRGFARPLSNCTVGAHEYQIPSVIVDAVTEPAGANCATGGYAILSGVDVDLDGTLDAFEVSSTDYLCAGLDAIQPLVRVTNEAAGANCAVGGKLVETGNDDNANDVLDAIEVASSFYVCNGQNGADGQDTLITTTAEPAGGNCANGGVRISAGLDDGSGGGVARNGTLEAGEVTSTSYACDGSDGSSSLVSAGAEPAGANCANGGQIIRIGLDNGDGGATANDGVLNTSEVDSTTYVCSGSDGTDGVNGNDGGCNAASRTSSGALLFVLLFLVVAPRKRAMTA